MHEQSWAKFGLLAVAGLGFVAILAVALNTGTDDLEGVDWVVETLVVEGAATAPLPGTELTARFEAGNVNGAAGCNTFFATYEIDGDSIMVGPAGSTMKFCAAPEGVMDQELNYLTLLGSADGFEVDDKSLSFSTDGAVTIEFVMVDSG